MQHTWIHIIQWITQYRYRVLFLGLWILVVITLLSQIITLETLSHYFILTKAFFTHNWWGWMIFLLLFTIRPIFLIPATILTLLSGVFFNVSGGLPTALTGAVISATVGYWIGRAFPLASGRVSSSQIKTWDNSLQKNPFNTSLIMHLTMLPFDAVNYFCGMLKIKFGPFLLGVAVGAIPGAINVVLIGASIDIEQVLAGTINLSVVNGWYILGAIVIFLASHAIRRYILKQKYPTQ